MHFSTTLIFLATVVAGAVHTVTASAIPYSSTRDPIHTNNLNWTRKREGTSDIASEVKWYKHTPPTVRAVPTVRPRPPVDQDLRALQAKGHWLNSVIKKLEKKLNFARVNLKEKEASAEKSKKKNSVSWREAEVYRVRIRQLEGMLRAAEKKQTDNRRQLLEYLIKTNSQRLPHSA
ncbi:hypothetical protein BC835DRAFT_1381002 [Cytidiella melzeri]|nr:hypothetical protein BC835DRAFT_1381002 [Cytidiella melzeri]